MGNKIEQKKLIDFLQQRFIITGQKDRVISVRERYSMDSMTIVVFQLFSSQQNVLLLNYIADFKKIKSKYLSKPIETYDCQSSLGFFQKSLKKYLLFDLPAFTLDQEISVRKSTARYFKDFQLWSILVSVISAMASLQRGNIRHQQISLDSIHLTNKGQVKIMNPWFTRKIQNQMQTGCLDQIATEPYYSTKSNCNFQTSVKNDVKQFAECVINAGCLYNSSNQLKSYNSAIFKERYKMKQLNELLELMEKQQMNRPDWISLQDMIVYQSLPQQQSRISFSRAKQQPNDPILIRNHSLDNSIKSFSDLRASEPIKFKNSQFKTNHSPYSQINQTLLFQPPLFKFHMNGQALTKTQIKPDPSFISYQAEPTTLSTAAPNFNSQNISSLQNYQNGQIQLPKFRQVELSYKAEPKTLERAAPKYKLLNSSFQLGEKSLSLKEPKFKYENSHKSVRESQSRTSPNLKHFNVNQQCSATNNSPFNLSRQERGDLKQEYKSEGALQSKNNYNKDLQRKREDQPSEVTLAHRKSGQKASQFIIVQKQQQIKPPSRCNSLPIFKSPSSQQMLKSQNCTVDPFVSDVKNLISSRLNSLTTFKQTSSLLTPFKQKGQNLKFYRPGPLASSSTKGISIRPVSLKNEKIFVRSPLRISYK